MNSTKGTCLKSRSCKIYFGLNACLKPLYTCKRVVQTAVFLKGFQKMASYRVYAVGSPFTQIGMVDKFCSTATVL